MTDQPRPVFNDRYELQQRIGRGGMADVYVARDRLLDRPVAIKVLFPEFATDPNFVERFRREAQSAASLNHPNVVSVYDWGRQGNTYFMAMEYVPGRTLADILRANGRLSAHQAAEIAIEVASALGFAHRSGVVHRDVKPANILIADDGRVKVADFGIARALNSAAEQDLTQAGAVMGTATYFSPEQAQGAQPDPRSDLYSLGIVLYEMVGGRPPFSGENPVAIAYKQVHDAPEPLNRLAPDVPRGFEAIVAKLLAKNPGVRYPTAGDLRDDLRRFREGLPVQALTQLLGNGAAGAATPPTGIQGPAATAVLPGVGAGGGVPRTTAMPSTPPAGATTPMARTAAAQPGPVPRQITTSGRSDPPRPPVSQQQYYEPPRRTGLYVLSGFLAIAALIAGGLLLFKQLSKDDKPLATKVLPDVRGQALDVAQKTLTDMGVQVQPIPEPNQLFGENVVWDQSPIPDTVVTPGLIVTLRYNPAQVITVVPDMAGKRFDEANQILANPPYSLVVTREDVEDPTRVAELVIGQDPPAGTELKPGDTIKLIVSKGKGLETIPAGLESQSAADVKTFLEAKGFVVKLIEEENDTIPAGAVTRTNPPGNTALDRGATVEVFISKGPSTVDVPELVGLSEGDARDALQSLDLKAKVQRVPVPFGDANAGKVTQQFPPKGTKAPKGTEITIQVAEAGAPPVTVPSTPPTTKATTTTPAPTTPTTVATTTTTTTIPATTPTTVPTTTTTAP